ncbi:beta-lactamase family protein [Sphingomonas sp. KRR8]|uniref:serine hydrolase domain-containing protein n=1 Tax=Sphingomonas sp. KRR8 TaxID=2942996 RepID=UPI002022770C|nr:serine hydrolase domain-containing protein [Sphingomonas sp. KRR8]URD62269.1 beta-lactamase family protein [Sphingomonas sp. KRR8]
MRSSLQPVALPQPCGGPVERFPPDRQEIGSGEEYTLKKTSLLGASAVLLVGAAIASVRVVDNGAAAHGRGSPPVAAANLALAKVSPEARRDINYAQLDARLKQLVTKPGMVGLAVGIVENGRITFVNGYGETQAGTGDKVTPQTVFRWASCSKGVAATMVAKLAEQGKVKLDAPVVNYAPGLKLPAAAEYRATVSDLLSHRLGLPKHSFDNKLEEGEPVPMLKAQLATIGLGCAPHSCWSYQNVAYDGASDIVARATGKSYQETVREQLFGPIGMTSASMTREGLMSSPSWARPHSIGRRPLEVTEPYYDVPSAGGVNSNIKDMALWMIAQTGAMPSVLSPRVLNALHAPLVKTPGERARMRKFLERLGDAYYGLGWRSYDYAGHNIVGHRGGINGYRSLILFDPAKKSGVVALWNSNTNQPGGLEFEVMDMLYHLPFRDWLELSKTRSRLVEPTDDTEDSGSTQVASRSGGGLSRSR